MTELPVSIGYKPTYMSENATAIAILFDRSMAAAPFKQKCALRL